MVRLKRRYLLVEVVGAPPASSSSPASSPPRHSSSLLPPPRAVAPFAAAGRRAKRPAPGAADPSPAEQLRRKRPRQGGSLARAPPAAASSSAAAAAASAGEAPGSRRGAHSIPQGGFDLLNAVKNSLASNFGEFGWACVVPALQVKYFNPATGTAILRTNREHFRLLWGALTLIEQVGRQPVAVRVLRSSGTLARCLVAGVEHHHRMLALEHRLEEGGLL